MKPKYFNSLDSLNEYTNNYPNNSFHLSPPRKCEYNSVRCSFDVTDKEDNDILKILVICPICANMFCFYSYSPTQTIYYPIYHNRDYCSCVK